MKHVEGKDEIREFVENEFAKFQTFSAWPITAMRLEAQINNNPANQNS